MSKVVVLGHSLDIVQIQFFCIVIASHLLVAPQKTRAAAGLLVGTDAAPAEWLPILGNILVI